MRFCNCHFSLQGQCQVSENWTREEEYDVMVFPELYPGAKKDVKSRETFAAKFLTKTSKFIVT